MHLTKHHGLGNDFLVLLDPDATTSVTSAFARSVCERHTGVGADGLLHVTASDVADVTMVLYNADGGRAEMSGNGISCLAQAVAARISRSMTTATIRAETAASRDDSFAPSGAADRSALRRSAYEGRSLPAAVSNICMRPGSTATSTSSLAARRSTSSFPRASTSSWSRPGLATTS